MAKKIIMIAPFDVLTGNLSGQQKLEYAENNNPAYEAPNGSMGARNYKTRYVGARRADGTTYFSVRQKSTAVLNGKTRNAMGLTAITALIISSCKKAQSSASYSWAKIKKAFEVDQENGTLPEGVDSVTKFANYYIRRMLQYKQTRWFRQSASSPLELHNPYDMVSADALVINAQKWLKFADLFSISNNAQGGLFYFVDGVKFYAPFVGSVAEPLLNDFDGLLRGDLTNLNYRATITGLALEDDNLKYNGQQVYNDTAAVTDADSPTANQKFTTIAPEP